MTENPSSTEPQEEDVGATLAGIYERPYMYPKQEGAIFSKARFACCEASTKSGKTVGCMAWLFEQGITNGGPNREFWWVAPSKNQALDVYNRMKNGLPHNIYSSNETLRTITISNGAKFCFKTGEEPDLLYGPDVYAAVLDEASRMREAAWFVMQSTLTATQGPARLIGNVKGKKNWFYRLCRRAQAGEPNLSYAKITALDAIEAGVIEKEVVEQARRDMPEWMFLELYYAEAGEDEGNPFGIDNIRRCIGPLGDGPVIAWGWDLARSVDYTVGIGLNLEGRVCAFYRWRKIPWYAQVQRVRVLTGMTPTLIDSTGVGDPVLEWLVRGGKDGDQTHFNFEGYNMTIGSKMTLIEGLIGAIQSADIGYPEGAISIELEMFEYTYPETDAQRARGVVSYGAPEGMHDDCVVALALATKKWREVKASSKPLIYTGRSLGLYDDD